MTIFKCDICGAEVDEITPINIVTSYTVKSRDNYDEVGFFTKIEKLDFCKECKCRLREAEIVSQANFVRRYRES